MTDLTLVHPSIPPSLHLSVSRILFGGGDDKAPVRAAIAKNQFIKKKKKSAESRVPEAKGGGMCLHLKETEAERGAVSGKQKEEEIKKR